jgi:hypothetical protein
MEPGSFLGAFNFNLLLFSGAETKNISEIKLVALIIISQHLIAHREVLFVACQNGAVQIFRTFFYYGVKSLLRIQSGIRSYNLGVACDADMELGTALVVLDCPRLPPSTPAASTLSF